MKEDSGQDEFGGRERRQYFRLKYQVVDRPKVIITGTKPSEVVDLSERGVRFIYNGGLVENPVKAKVCFKSGMEIELEGTIKRIHDNEICLNLKDAIPLRMLMDEQRRLYKKYGVVMEADEH